jgi:hypothetical protein
VELRGTQDIAADCVVTRGQRRTERKIPSPLSEKRRISMSRKLEPFVGLKVSFTGGGNNADRVGRVAAVGKTQLIVQWEVPYVDDEFYLCRSTTFSRLFLKCTST